MDCYQKPTVAFNPISMVHNHLCLYTDLESSNLANLVECVKTFGSKM